MNYPRMRVNYKSGRSRLYMINSQYRFEQYRKAHHRNMLLQNLID